MSVCFSLLSATSGRKLPGGCGGLAVEVIPYCIWVAERLRKNSGSNARSNNPCGLRSERSSSAGMKSNAMSSAHTRVQRTKDLLWLNHASALLLRVQRGLSLLWRRGHRRRLRQVGVGQHLPILLGLHHRQPGRGCHLRGPRPLARGLNGLLLWIRWVLWRLLKPSCDSGAGNAKNGS